MESRRCNFFNTVKGKRKSILHYHSIKYKKIKSEEILFLSNITKVSSDDDLYLDVKSQ